MTALVLLATDLVCERGGRRVFEHLSFRVASGEAAVVTGRNGAGKSSLLRLVAGLVGRAGGALELLGRNPDLGIGEHCHYAGHADALKNALTVMENLAFWRDLYGDPWLAPADALDRLGVGHLADYPAAYLSAGQRRRLALARLFVSRRPIWLLDEPTSALDVATQATLARAMADHLADGGIILAATHADIGLRPDVEIAVGRPTFHDDEI